VNAAELKQAARVVKALTQNKIMAYQPYPKQREFHALGEDHRERALLASNQSGKTHAAGSEISYHTTGRYPDWWEGRRFDGPVRGWVAGTSAEGTRDTVQRILLGDILDPGTGTIPKSSIRELKKARTVNGAIGQMFIHHVSGGTSYIGVRTYEQPIERWAGESLNFVWYDEEPPLAHYTEGLTRLNARKGIAMLTMTPLLGMTKTVKQFYPHPTTFDRALVMMTIDDVGHFTDNEKEQIIASYPEYEREARTRGIPMLGSGRVFPVTMESISCKPFEIPEHWPLLGGIDFGWDHATGCVATAWDRDADCIYITHVYKERERTPSQMAVELKHWNGNAMPWTWPHDGYVHDRGSGVSIADQYRREGVRMLREHATFETGGHGLEAGLLDMLQRMQSGRFKVFHHLEDWFGEFNIYHRKDGRVVKESDDLISATRMCVMAKRFARVSEQTSRFPQTVSSGDPFATNTAAA
jgi:phage terminase large subunit-like protein